MIFDDSPDENIPPSAFPQHIRPFSFLHLPFPLPELAQPLMWQPADRSRPFIKPELMPSDPEHLALKQTVSDWLVAGIHFDHAESRFREKRRFLEAHLELLAPESDLVLQDIMIKTADKAQIIDALRQHIS